MICPLLPSSSWCCQMAWMMTPISYELLLLKCCKHWGPDWKWGEVAKQLSFLITNAEVVDHEIESMVMMMSFLGQLFDWNRSGSSHLDRMWLCDVRGKVDSWNMGTVKSLERSYSISKTQVELISRLGFESSHRLSYGENS